MPDEGLEVRRKVLGAIGKKPVQRAATSDTVVETAYIRAGQPE